MRAALQREPTPREKAEARFRLRLEKHSVPADIASDPARLAAYKAGFVASYGDGLVDGVKVGLDLRSAAGGFVTQANEDELPA